MIHVGCGRRECALSDGQTEGRIYRQTDGHTHLWFEISVYYLVVVAILYAGYNLRRDGEWEGVGKSREGREVWRKGTRKEDGGACEREGKKERIVGEKNTTSNGPKEDKNAQSKVNLI
jgi:hypothetical protein